MNRIAGWGLALILTFLALAGLFTRQRATPLHTAPAAAPAMPSRPTHVPGVVAGDAAAEDQGSIDLYGNDVSPAVATYSFDALGSLYEVHSPQTQLPRLGSPKT